jgi:hypothetical protein
MELGVLTLSAVNSDHLTAGVWPRRLTPRMDDDEPRVVLNKLESNVYDDMPTKVSP